MLERLLSWFGKDRDQSHEAVFNLRQGVIGERRVSTSLKDLADVAKEKLETFADLVEATKKYEGGDQDVAEAARALREGFATLIATPAHLFSIDGETRQVAMQIPSNGSTSSPPMLANGHPGGSSQKALPNAANGHQADPATPPSSTPESKAPEQGHNGRSSPSQSAKKKRGRPSNKESGTSKGRGPERFAPGPRRRSGRSPSLVTVAIAARHYPDPQRAALVRVAVRAAAKATAVGLLPSMCLAAIGGNELLAVFLIGLSSLFVVGAVACEVIREQRFPTVATTPLSLRPASTGVVPPVRRPGDVLSQAEARPMLHDLINDLWEQDRCSSS